MLSIRSWFVLLLAFASSLAVEASGASAFAAATSTPALKFKAVLVWGTNEEKTNYPELKEVDAHTLKKLRGVFKWKNYFEMKATDISVESSKVTKQVMSEHCQLEIENLGDNKARFKLFGKGKLVVNQVKPIEGTTPIVLGGDSLNDTAWFVILTPVVAK